MKRYFMFKNKLYVTALLFFSSSAVLASQRNETGSINTFLLDNCFYLSIFCLALIIYSGLKIYSLKQSSLILNALKNQKELSLIATDVDGIITSFNKGAEYMLGYKASELVGKKTPLIFHEKSEIEEMSSRLNELFEGDDLIKGFEVFTKLPEILPAADSEWSYIRKDGSRLKVSLSVSPVRNIRKKVIGYVGVARDVTDLAVAREKLYKSEKKYRTLFESSNDAIMTLAPPDWRFTSANNSIAKIFGFEKIDEFLLTCPAECSPEFQPDGRSSQEKSLKMIEKAMSEGSNYFEWTHKRKNGETFDATVLLTRVQLNKRIFLQATVRDVTEQKNMEINLRKNREWLATILESIGDCVIVTDSDKNIQFMNSAAQILTGWKAEDSRGKAIDEILKIENSAFEKNNKDNNLFSEDTLPKILISRNGNRIPVSLKSSLIDTNSDKISGAVLVIRDISSEIRMQRQLHQAGKLDALGQLAGGIAHDFNNMLAGIIGGAEILKLQVNDDPETAESIDIILKSAERASGLTRQLLLFARKETLICKNIGVHDIIETSIKILRRSLDKSLNISSQLSSPSDTVLGDSGQLQSIFLNLCINASHAVEANGIIKIKTEQITIDPGFCKNSTFKLSPGPYIKIDVSDNGKGIPAKNLSKIFDPFFTTKEVGKGTGLGLAAVHGSIIQHKGSITAESLEGKGTEFTILLPLVTENSVALKKADMCADKTALTILVVDDESILRSAASSILATLGHKAFLAKNGLEAVEIFKIEHRTIDLVLLDIVMPVMGGAECFDKLMEIDSEVPIILCSGYTREENIDTLIDKGAYTFIQKPYRIGTLKEIIRKAL
jgi:PAS domain S-box-containing protein